MNKTVLKVCATTVGCSLVGVMLVGCTSAESTSFTEAEKAQLKNGAAPPPGFAEEMKKQQRIQLEKSKGGKAPAPL
ncbi:MAG: hypothetical protein KY445_01610 [Armatimonadetes bacterium]|nr:hypothetical protein [Armatimonadota bacterium]